MNKAEAVFVFLLALLLAVWILGGVLGWAS
jgi:hypothetical protein